MESKAFNNIVYGLLTVLVVINIYLIIKMRELDDKRDKMRVAKAKAHKELMKRE